MTRPRRFAVFTIAGLAVLAIGFLIAVPAFDLAAPGRLLHWHIEQPAYYEGLAEAVVLYLVVLTGFALPARRAGAVLAGAAIALYLRRHHVDAPAFAALVYFEAFIATGALALSGLRGANEAAFDRMLQWLAGLCLVALVLLASSLAGYGRPADLLVVGTIGSVLLLAFARREPIALAAIRSVATLRGVDRALAVGLVVWVVVLLARTNQAVGYDPLWYGLRPEYVLAPERSLFDETGLVAPAFYVPKLYELVLMPLSGANDFSFPLAFGIFTLAFFGYVAFAFARRLGADLRFALAAGALVMTIPAISNLALSPKPDVLAGLLIVVAAFCLHRALVSRDGSAAAYGTAAGALAFNAKLVAMPYVGVLLLSAAAIAVVGRLRDRGCVPRPAWTRPDRAALVILACALLVSVALIARTVLLAGVPTIGPDPLMRLWTALGFELRQPIGTLQWTRPQDFSDLPQLVADLLLFPARLAHVVITWIGNVWLWLAAYAGFAALVLRRRPAIDAHALALVLPLLGLGMFLALGIAYHFRGGDGNYLIAPLALGTIATSACAASIMRGVPAFERTAFAGIAAASVFHLVFSFANAWWSMPGTRAFDLDLTRSPIDTRHMRREVLVASGLGAFEQWLRDSPRGLRVVGYAEPEDHAYWLSTRYEALGTLNFTRPDLVFDAAGFARLLEIAKIDVVLLPKQFDPRLHSPVVFAHMADRAREGAVVVRDFGKYSGYELSARRSR